MSVFKLINKNVLSFVSARSVVVDQAKSRSNWLAAFFLIGYALIAFRAFDLSVIRGPGFADLQEVRAARAEVKTPRGDILDRNGILLATSVETASLYADPKQIPNPREVADDIKALWSDVDVFDKIDNDKRFVWLKRHITPTEQAAIMDMGHPGLGFQNEWKRLYPFADMGAHWVGCANLDEKGLCGFERVAQESLSRGENLTLSMDVRVQHILHKHLSEAFEKHQAIGGAGVVMDIETGEILAASSLPGFDPNDLSSQSQKNLFNRLTQGVYELGSTFKIFSTAAYLENVSNDFSNEFDVKEPIKVGRFRINDYHAEERILTLPEVFIHSSNIGTAKMALEIGTDTLKNFYKDLGLFDPLNIQLKEKAAPLLPRVWREASTLTASYGHGIAVTPLHLVQATASILNKGALVHPSFTKVDIQSDAHIQVVSPAVSEQMNKLLRLVVTHGTGKNADIHGFLVGGKTGTAEKIGKSGYDSSKLISSFIGAFPMNSPKYIVFIMLDEPKATKDTFGYATGGWVAAPVVKKIVSQLSSLYGILPADEQSAHQTLTQPLLKFLQEEQQKSNLPQSGQTNIASN